MYNKSQEAKIIDKLRKTKKVSRNWALSNNISRLGAIIKALVNDGWLFDSRESKTGKSMRHGHFVKTRFSEDYVYDLVAEPKRK